MVLNAKPGWLPGGVLDSCGRKLLPSTIAIIQRRYFQFPNLMEGPSTDETGLDIRAGANEIQ